jgi:hypothetical protein
MLKHTKFVSLHVIKFKKIADNNSESEGSSEIDTKDLNGSTSSAMNGSSMLSETITPAKQDTSHSSKHKSSIKKGNKKARHR